AARQPHAAAALVRAGPGRRRHRRRVRGRVRRHRRPYRPPRTHRLAREPAMTDATTSDELSIDQRLALRTAARRLEEDFSGLYGEETIERFLSSSYDQFAIRSTVPHFLPLLAERFARQRLTALAKVEGLRDDGRPVVLFLCVHNAGRS